MEFFLKRTIPITGIIVGSFIISKSLFKPPTQISSNDVTGNTVAELELNKEMMDRILMHIPNDNIYHYINTSDITTKQKALDISKFGLPSIQNIRYYPSYICSINYCTKIPNWTMELLTKEDIIKNDICDRKYCKFYEDKTVPIPFRCVKEDYYRSGYSRGHLVAAGNHNDIQLNKDVTFALSSNVVPQELTMNGAQWLNLERFVQELLLYDKFDEIYVINGPIFMDRHMNFIGNNNIWVPSHLFKVILCKNNDDSNNVYIAGFVMKNSSCFDKIPLYEYMADISYIEEKTGLILFDKILHHNNNEYNVIPLNDKMVIDRMDCERVTGFRYQARIKSAKRLDILDKSFKEYLDYASNNEDIPEWSINLTKKTYHYRKQYICDIYQNRIDNYQLQRIKYDIE